MLVCPSRFVWRNKACFILLIHGICFYILPDINITTPNITSTGRTTPRPTRIVNTEKKGNSKLSDEHLNTVPFSPLTLCSLTSLALSICF